MGCLQHIGLPMLTSKRNLLTLLLLCHLTGWCWAHMVGQYLECDYYDPEKCNPAKDPTCSTTQRCTSEKADEYTCFVLWNVTQGETTVKMKGCFLTVPECSNGSECVETRSSVEKLKFCCCKSNFCNREFEWRPIVSVTTTPKTTEVLVPKASKQEIVTILLYTLIPLIGVAVSVLVFLLCRRHKLPYFTEVPTMEPSAPPEEIVPPGHLPIELIEVKARGRFGAVWKATYNKTETVAVKIFPVQDKQSWQAEQAIFQLPHMDHDDILRFIGVEQHGDYWRAEFWLITAYHEKGSLCDYLKANVVTWAELCTIAESMARGLMHLHDELPPTKGMDYKPAIAHRDFKSKNVLLKDDLTACIADFGLALVFEPGKPCGDTHGQVGTRRYMAPEVLEGAINFSSDAFLRIDMYACGLVLWELASRCTAQDGQIPEYRLPFEEEVGLHPSLEDMQECVVHKKKRPHCPIAWRKHSGMAALCDTVEECWDHDAEARLSASCVMERIIQQTRILAATNQPSAQHLLNINGSNHVHICEKDASI